MGSQKTTIALLLALILAMMWTTGRLQRILDAVFGTEQKQ